MSETAVAARIREYLVARMGADEARLGGETLLFEQGILDSMNVLELTLHLEQAFGFRVRPTEIVPENFESLDAMARFVVRKSPP